jgi:hypothetical protein
MAILYLQLLPEIFARRRFGGRGGVEGSLWWACLIAIAALMAWPFFAAAWIEWDRDPSFLTVLLMAFGSAAAGFAVQFVVQTIVGAYVGGLTRDDDASAIMAFGKAFGAAVTLLLIGLTVAAYWTIRPEFQDCMTSRYC